MVLKQLVRKIIWKIIGADPRLEDKIDLIEPRKKMMDYAIALIDHHTRLSRRCNKIGKRRSLLGDYLEFGCYKGEMVIYAFTHAAALMPWMRFFAFDSFLGLPGLKEADADGSFWQGQFACRQKEFMANLRKSKVDSERIICVPGWFADTLTPELKRRMNLTLAAIVYIDCDLYESCVPVLNFITDLVETGSILVFDDWFSFKANPERGIQKACAEWLLKNPRIILQDWHLFGAYGKSFIVKIKV